MAQNEPETIRGETDAICAGCSEPRPIVYEAIRPLCGPCFEDFLLKKFMRSMRVAKIQTGDVLVLGLSNGKCSAVLADLFGRSMRPRDQLQIRTVFVDFHQSEFQLQLERHDWAHVDLVVPVPDIANPDAFHEWRRAEVLHRLSQAARQSGSGVVLIGDCSETLATNMLSCTASGGRGLGAVDRCQPSTTIDDVLFIRPLHLITMEQITIWAEYQNLHYVSDETPSEGVYGTTYHFLKDLQSTFPSCISNIIRTTGKLICDDQWARCQACRDPIDSESRFCHGCMQSGLDLIFDNQHR